MTGLDITEDPNVGRHGGQGRKNTVAGRRAYYRFEMRGYSDRFAERRLAKR